MHIPEMENESSRDRDWSITCVVGIVLAVVIGAILGIMMGMILLALLHFIRRR